MGSDKAGLEIGGMSLLEHTARAALGAGLPVLVAGRTRPADWRLKGTLFADDDQPGLGPLGGLETALRQANGPVLALACDLPLLTSDAVRWLQAQEPRAQAEQNSECGVIVVNGGQWEPLFSIYRPACLPLIASRLAEGRRSLHGLIEAGRFAFVPAPDWVGETLVNVNTKEEWQQIHRKK